MFRRWTWQIPEARTQVGNFLYRTGECPGFSCLEFPVDHRLSIYFEYKRLLGRIGRKALNVMRRLTIISKPIRAECADPISATQSTGSNDKLSRRLFTSPRAPVYLNEKVYVSSTFWGSSLLARMVNWMASRTFLLRASNIPFS